MAMIIDIFDAQVRVSGNFQYFSLLKKDDREEGQRTLNDMAKQIKRHVDNVGSVEIYLPYVCEFCESRWEVDEGLPACCTKAQEEAREAMKEESDGKNT